MILRAIANQNLIGTIDAMFYRITEDTGLTRNVVHDTVWNLKKAGLIFLQQFPVRLEVSPSGRSVLSS